ARSRVATRRERAADAAHGLPRSMLVLDERHPDEVVAVLSEADPRRHRHLRLLQQELRELDGAHRLPRIRDLGPDEHRRPRRADVPAGALEPAAEDNAPP